MLLLRTLLICDILQASAQTQVVTSWKLVAPMAAEVGVPLFYFFFGEGGTPLIRPIYFGPKSYVEHAKPELMLCTKFEVASFSGSEIGRGTKLFVCSPSPDPCRFWS